jgi:hypothetical protein
MRRTAIIVAMLAFVLQACVPGVLTGDAATGDAATIAGEDVAATTLADPLQPAMVDAAEPLEPVAETAVEPADPGARPKPRPDAVTEVAAEAPAPALAVPEPAKSREQIRCEKAKGRWQAIAGGAGHLCVRNTRDGGKACLREGQCDGQCLARSKTCAPIDPLLGCNDVLQEDGRRVTLCLD